VPTNDVASRNDEAFDATYNTEVMDNDISSYKVVAQSKEKKCAGY
jgi:hypothetical protein